MATEKRLGDINAMIAYFKEQCEVASKDSEIESLYTLAALKCCIDYFEHFPTVDAVEVVRCKDCIYYHKKLGIGFGQCSKCTLMPYPEDFCSYGERKDNERKAD